MGSFGLHTRLECTTGVAIHLDAAGDILLRTVSLAAEKNQVYIQRQKEYEIKAHQLAGQNVAPVNLLKKQLNTLTFPHPVALSLSGKGILIKKVNRIETLNPHHLQQVFPAYRPEEFYLQHFSSGEYSYFAFIRKELADPILEAFSRQGITLLMFSLGPFVVDPVIPQLNCYGTTLIFDGHQVVLSEEKHWQDYHYLAGSTASYPLKVDITDIPAQLLLAYATAFQLLLQDRLEPIRVELDELATALADHSAKLKFQGYAKILLISLFILLLCNFLLLSFYQSENQALLDRAGARSHLFANKQQVLTTLKEKELKVSQLGWNKGYRYAYLCDQIGQTVPAGIILKELTINKTQQPSAELSRQPNAEPGAITIKGTSPGVYQLNDWLYALQQRPWVKKIRLEKYVKDQQQETEEFTLSLNY